ncbi:ATP phosphoribosyltransferase regulatory subunit [Roseivivax marinus]|uniref:ATP phosphoribosyltransferase regulatory subunit n=1 Tax=Roseivivax marinus TaxID=1379903 RepID=UPI001F03AC2D|nr:ATP phosphoribosyltransferase regulatory subunit [Roseivivax marinus]UMA63831.1 ATP phosphoribosyltransferase regulatory subunit [Roseivivax marinus]
MSRAEARDLAARFCAAFETAGAVPVDCDILQSAETLLDLYGEDIRSRAYVTQDPALGERMLRPDFTVPVVEAHMRDGAEPARYTYAGEVFRRQEDDPERAPEYIQAGYEIFDGRDAEDADAAVFARFAELLAEWELTPATGDIGILSAAIRGLETSERRRSALLRHIWRPRRFRALLDRYAGRTPVPATRTALLEAANPMAAAGPMIGRRTEAEIRDRLVALREDAAEPPLSDGQVDLIETLLKVSETCPYALQHLRDMEVDLPALRPAVDRFARRCDRLAAQGVDVDTLDFEASYGRTSMEYYDGFVFGFSAVRRPDLPPVATGGRYDALTARLGQGRTLPAVGGVIRPDLLLALTEDRA